MSAFVEKLVRDLMPELIRAKGETVEVRIAPPAEMPLLLGLKLMEESAEFFVDPSLDEMADVMEVLDTLRALYGWTEKDVCDAQERKRILRGGFNDRNVLKVPREE